MLEIRKEGISSAGDARRAYDVIYKEKGIRHLDSFYRWFLTLLKPAMGKRLLDVSCGEGVLLQWAHKAGLLAYGLDISAPAIETARANCPEAKLVVGEAEALPFPDGYFDYLTNIGSVEHYWQPEKGLREMARVLKGKGRAAILVPNAFGLLWNVYAVLRTGDISDDGQPLQRYATRKEWQSMLERNGWVVQQVRRYDREWPRSLRDAWWYLGHPKKLAVLLLSPFIPTNLAGSLVFLCTRKGGCHCEER